MGQDESNLPRFVTEVPWYAHKKTRNSIGSIKEFEIVKTKVEKKTRGKAGDRLRSGCCANCGAHGHTPKECLERIRRRKASHIGVQLCSDDIILPESTKDIETTVGTTGNEGIAYEKKRDRWRGYDDEHHVAYTLTKMDQINVLAELDDETGSKMRIREDVASYLSNKDGEYDPKCRLWTSNKPPNTTNQTSNTNIESHQEIQADPNLDLDNDSNISQPITPVILTLTALQISEDQETIPVNLTATQSVTTDRNEKQDSQQLQQSQQLQGLQGLQELQELQEEPSDHPHITLIDSNIKKIMGDIDLRKFDAY